jgi:integrase
MTRIRLPFVQEFRDRHGRVRRYFRRPGFKRVALPGVPGSAEFLSAYEAALGTSKLLVGRSRTKPGSINDLIVKYYAAAFPALAPITRSTYRNVIERFRVEHGEKPVAGLRREHVRAMLSALQDTPGAANKMLRTIKMLMRFAIDEGMRPDDPTFRVRRVRPASGDGFREWTEAEVAAFEARHPVGTEARLALDLFQWTAQRRADVVRMGPQHIEHRDGIDSLKVRQQKTGVEVLLPIHPRLAASLAATPTGHLCFLTTAAGKPFTAAGFGNWFHDRCAEAGLMGVSAHGLRKVALRRLAEAGSTDSELMAFGGHKTRSEITRYTRGASQRIGARAAMARLMASQGEDREQLVVKPALRTVKP